MFKYKMAQKIYTRKGDEGYTSIMGTRTRYLKSDPRIEAIGTIDELNSYIGLIRSFNVADHDMVLKWVQNDLFNIGANLANFNYDPNRDHISYQIDVNGLEQKMDAMSKELKPLTNFILPGGNQLISFCHVARTVCRRAERSLVEVENIDRSILSYINRLSDYFFVLARKLAQENNIEEVIWTSK
jgi:cob(I)alamin adenosyltransferase